MLDWVGLWWVWLKHIRQNYVMLCYFRVGYVMLGSSFIYVFVAHLFISLFVFIIYLRIYIFICFVLILLFIFLLNNEYVRFVCVMMLGQQLFIHFISLISCVLLFPFQNSVVLSKDSAKHIDVA
jgi:hypothetical protein